jgi:polysaccharide export outer membrane protein
LALIGSVEAINRTLPELKQQLINKLKPDYLLNPRVGIEVLNYRPFYILGEVKKPKSYPYVDGMSYLNAVAIAGGYTYRAKEDYVMVSHAGDTNKRKIKLKMTDKVMPGDVIHIEERFF